MTAITFSEGSMNEDKETGKFNPALGQTAAILLAVILGSGGVTQWNQSSLHEVLREHKEEHKEVIAHMRNDIDDLRKQVIGSHNIRDVMRIQQAISAMDQDDSDQWTGDGKPRIYAIEVRLREAGYPYVRVTAAMRDMAWGLSRMGK